MTALLFPSSDHKVARKLTWMFSLPNSIDCFSVFAPFSSLSVSLSASFILFIAYPPSFLSFLLEQHICVFVNFFICLSFFAPFLFYPSGFSLFIHLLGLRTTFVKSRLISESTTFVLGLVSEKESSGIYLKTATAGICTE